jgi:hypothetical protein
MSKAEEHTPEEQAEFDKQKQEHPTFTDEQIWQIVADHMAKGGPGSGCNPAAGDCGRPSTGGSKDELASFRETGPTEAGQRALDDSKKPGYKGPIIIDATGTGGKVPPRPTEDRELISEGFNPRSMQPIGDGSDASSAQSEVTNAPRRHSPESEAKFKDEIANRQVGRTIVDQLGGNKFRVMTGAKDFVLHDKAVSFRVPQAKDGINHVKVSLNASDTYDVTFTRIRGAKATEVHALKDIYADQLQSVFKDKTGLDTHL